TGMSTARAAWCARWIARGLIAGPDKPPVRKLRRGRYALRSIDIPTNVLIAHRASAPADSTARAMTPISLTIGVSLTHTGSLVRLRTASVTAAAARGSLPKYSPPCSTLGQEMLISKPATPGTPSRSDAISPYSDADSPLMLTSTGNSHSAHFG